MQTFVQEFKIDQEKLCENIPVKYCDVSKIKLTKSANADFQH